MKTGKFSNDRHPLSGEICTITDNKGVKVSALLFDRIYTSTQFHQPNDAESFYDIPEEITFGVSKFEDEALQVTIPQIPELIKKADLKNIKETANQFGIDFVSIFAVQLSNVYKRHGVDVIPSFQSFKQFQTGYPEGAILAYQAALNNLPLVSEDNLSWKQVMGFRKDKDAVNKYRSLRLWLTDGLKAKSINHATDIIAKRIEDYQWAIKKHGLNTVTGVFSKIISLSSISAIATGAGMTAIIGGPLWAAIVAGTITSAEVGVWLLERHIDKLSMAKEEYSDIAILYEAKKVLEKSK